MKLLGLYLNNNNNNNNSIFIDYCIFPLCIIDYARNKILGGVCYIIQHVLAI